MAGETESGGDTHPADLFGEERSFGAPGPQCRLLRASGDTPQGGAGILFPTTVHRDADCTVADGLWRYAERERRVVA